MAKKSRPTFQKREKEKARQQKQKEKEQRRVESKERRATEGPRIEGEDPDIAAQTQPRLALQAASVRRRALERLLRLGFEGL